MISPRTVCFVYFALLFGTRHVKSTDSSVTNPPVPSVNVTEDTTSATAYTNDIMPTSNNNRETSKLHTAVETSVCTQPTPKPEEGLYIFFLPTGKDTVQLIVPVLTVSCLALLLTTLTCACHVCHLRGILSSLQPRSANIHRHARREKSESPCRDGGQVDGHPTETCFMLSEVTTAQDESREDEENKTEEKNDTEQPSTESPVKDPNGDIAQENSPEPDAKAPESSDTGV